MPSRACRAFALCLFVAAGCGGSTATSGGTTGATTQAGERVVAGDGWSLAVPRSFSERLAGDYDAWFEPEDGSTVVAVKVWRDDEGSAYEIEAVAEIIEGRLEETGGTCSLVSDAAVEGLPARRFACTDLEEAPPSDDGPPLDQGSFVVAVRANWAFYFECLDRTGACDALLRTVRIDRAIAPSGRADRASLARPASFRVAYPFDSDLEGADAQRMRVSADDAPGRGSPRPLVTMVQFTDLQCPFCRRVEPTLTALLERYADLRIVVRHNPLPFHPEAPVAAEACEEARRQGGDVAFFRLLDGIFGLAPGWGRTQIVELAAQQGLDTVELNAALDDHRHRARVQEDVDLAARVGAHGTPNFFINGRQLVGAQPLESFTDVIDEEMALARLALERGVPREAIYSAALARALESADEIEAPTVDPAPTPLPPDPMLVYRVPADTFPSRGPRDALVTIVEFTDFECPFCQRVTATLDALVAQYGNDLRIVVRNNPLPFHQNAQLAAEASLEAYAQGGNEKYFRYIALLFEHQRTLSRDTLEDLAARVGLDMRRFRRALDNHTHARAIEADSALARSLGAGGTPTFFINGHNLRGAQPLDAFRAVVDRELAEARALVASGTPRARLYDAIIRDGLTAAPPTRYAPGNEPAAPEVYEVRFENRAPSRGAQSAPILLQLFTDMQCPFCARHVPTLEEVLRRYDGQVRLEFRNYPLPFHTHAMLAAEVGREVFVQLGDDAFFRYHDAVFAAQTDLSRERILAIARAIPRFNAQRLDRALAAGTHRTVIEAEMAVMRASGMSIGTPALLVDGHLVAGAVPFDEIATVIDARLTSRGVTPRRRP